MKSCAFSREGRKHQLACGTPIDFHVIALLFRRRWVALKLRLCYVRSDLIARANPLLRVRCANLYQCPKTAALKKFS
jgi:hypothetical protein